MTVHRRSLLPLTAPRRRRTPTRTRFGPGVALLLRVVVVLAVLLSGACSDSDGGQPTGDGTSPPGRDGGTSGDAITAPADALPELGRLRVVVTGGRAIVVDGDRREVLLRGANFNSLGDYYQADPRFEPTQPPTEEDWDAMAAAGFSVVRLVVSWSALEPRRGEIDQGYLQQIHAAVDAAAERRIYTVIDMHQDAWGKFVASPPDVRCPEGTEPAVGWDGAPQWATVTDGADTCRPVGVREAAPAVRAAFTAFYENRDGLRDAFAATWARLAAEFASDTNVAGYDLFNEPNIVFDAATGERRYTELVSSVIDRIRAAEQQARGFPHIVFLEPIVVFPLPGTVPTEGFTTDTQIVFAPHNYAEVIGPKILTVEQAFDAAAATASTRGWPLWIGEHGVFATDDATLDVLDRFAAAQDEHLAGGAQWQWRQWCGDPHTIGVPGGEPSATVVQLNDVSCPENVDAGPNLDLMRVAGRAYPRAAPGHLTELRSDPATGELRLTGAVLDDLSATSDLVIWIPGDERPDLRGEGVGRIELTRTTGGWYATAPVTDSPYEVVRR